MPLTLITGRANTGKTGAAYVIIRRALKDGQAPVLVVPQSQDVQRAREEFTREPSLGMSIMTFEELVAGMWEGRGDGRAIVDGATNALMIARSLRLACLDVGYRRAAAVLADSLMEQTGTAWRRAEAPGVETDHMASTLKLYSGHLEERGLIGRAEAAWLLSQQDELPAAPLVFHRFDDFTPSQIVLVKALAKAAPVSVTLTWEEGFAPTRALDPLVARLSPDVVLTSGTAAYNTPAEIEVFADSLFGDPVTFEAPKVIRFAVAEGEEAQCALVLGFVQEAVERGTACNRIVVALRDARPHYQGLKRAFLDAGISADFDVSLRMRDVAFGAAMLDALRSFANDDIAALLSVIRTPYSGLEPETARALEAEVRRRGVTSVAALQVGRLGQLEGVRRALARVAAEPAEWRAVAEALSGLFAAAWRGRQSLEDGECAKDAKAHRAALDVLEAAVHEGDVEVAELLTVLEDLTVRIGGDSTDRVQVLPVTRLRGRRFDMVIVAGLNAAEFPAVPDESALPGSRMHDIIRRFGGSRVEGNGPEFEALLFYETITRATQQLVLVGKEADDDGEALALSPFWQQAADRYAPDREMATQVPGVVARALVGAPRLEARGREAINARARALMTHEPRIAAAARRMRGRPARLSRAVEVPEVLSASQIETYLSCPYRWFYDRMIGGRELESTFGARDEGELAHVFLKETYEALIESGHRRVTVTNLQDTLGVLEHVAARHERDLPGNGLAQRVGCRMARRWVSRILEQDAADDSGFEPLHFEWSFGYDVEPVDFGEFALRGRIDRLDTDGCGNVVVTDYKRSAKAGLNGEALLSKGAVQVLLYMEAVERAVRLKPVAGVYRGLKEDKTTGVVEAGTDAVPQLKRKDAELSADKLVELRQKAVQMASAAVDGMRAGRIEPQPLSNDACVFCGAQHVCGEAL